MSPLLMGLLGVMLAPLFVAKWRASLLGLSCQGILIAWAAYRLDPNLHAPGTWLSLLDLGFVRGVLAPLLLYRVMGSQAAAASHVAPPNLLTWTVAFGLVIGAFNLAPALVPVEGDQRAIVSVATASVLLAFLVLASQSSPFSQIVGALRLENGIALFELSAEHGHGASLLVRLGQMAIVVGTIGLYVGLLRRLLEPSAATAAAEEEPTL